MQSHAPGDAKVAGRKAGPAGQGTAHAHLSGKAHEGAQRTRCAASVSRDASPLAVVNNAARHLWYCSSFVSPLLPAGKLSKLSSTAAPASAAQCGPQGGIAPPQRLLQVLHIALPPVHLSFCYVTLHQAPLQGLGCVHERDQRHQLRLLQLCATWRRRQDILKWAKKCAIGRHSWWAEQYSMWALQAGVGGRQLAPHVQLVRSRRPEVAAQRPQRDLAERGPHVLAQLLQRLHGRRPPPLTGPANANEHYDVRNAKGHLGAWGFEAWTAYLAEEVVGDAAANDAQQCERVPPAAALAARQAQGPLQVHNGERHAGGPQRVLHHGCGRQLVALPPGEHFPRALLAPLPPAGQRYLPRAMGRCHDKGDLLGLMRVGGPYLGSGRGGGGRRGVMVRCDRAMMWRRNACVAHCPANFSSLHVHRRAHLCTWAALCESASADCSARSSSALLLHPAPTPPSCIAWAGPSLTCACSSSATWHSLWSSCSLARGDRAICAAHASEPTSLPARLSASSWRPLIEDSELDGVVAFQLSAPDGLWGFAACTVMREPRFAPQTVPGGEWCATNSAAPHGSGGTTTLLSTHATWRLRAGPRGGNPEIHASPPLASLCAPQVHKAGRMERKEAPMCHLEVRPRRHITASNSSSAPPSREAYGGAPHQAPGVHLYHAQHSSRLTPLLLLLLRHSCCSCSCFCSCCPMQLLLLQLPKSSRVGAKSIQHLASEDDDDGEAEGEEEGALARGLEEGEGAETGARAEAEAAAAAGGGGGGDAPALSRQMAGAASSSCASTSSMAGLLSTSASRPENPTTAMVVPGSKSGSSLGSTAATRSCSNGEDGPKAPYPSPWQAQTRVVLDILTDEMHSH
eukprot:jgi/Mesen1/10434/ME000082S09946